MTLTVAALEADNFAPCGPPNNGTGETGAVTWLGVSFKAPTESGAVNTVVTVTLHACDDLGACGEQTVTIAVP
ncbi:MAG: hypothetical protein R3C68_16850 [Myxococcota bacterium]